MVNLQELRELVNPVVNTAKSCLDFDAKNGDPDSRQLLDILGFTAKSEENAKKVVPPEMMAVARRVTPVFSTYVESRFHGVNRLLLSMPERTIVDLPCGYTARGIKMSHVGRSYFGFDLPAVIDVLAPAVEKIIGSDEAIRYAAVDATNYKTLEAPLTGTTAPLVITTEGLLMYFTQPELEEVFANIHKLLQKHGTNMYRQNAQLFAKFIVNLVNHDATPQARTALAAATAASLREWRDFGFGDKGMAAFANAAKDMANAVIRDYMKPGNADKFNDNILGTMTADANRATFILNGTTYRKTPAAQLIPAFKSLVPDPKKQKALSSWLNQLCASTFKMPSMGVQYNETGVNAIKLPGAGALANIDMTTGIYMNDLLDSYGHDLVHDLQVSPDGKTATITQTVTADLSSPGSQMYKKISFGQVTLSQRLVIDLTAEIPTIKDYQIAQEFDW